MSSPGFCQASPQAGAAGSSFRGAVVGPRLQGGHCLPLGAVGNDRWGRNAINDLEEVVGIQTRDDKEWQKKWSQQMAGRV